ncbi:MAG: DUF6788 family protein [Acidimicrobiales bacterium]
MPRRVNEVPRMLRGTVVTHSRRCGKPNCRCASGEELHEQVILTYSKQSRARSVSLPKELIRPVTQATARYRTARQKLEAEANAGLDQLVVALGRRAGTTRSAPPKSVTGTSSASLRMPSRTDSPTPSSKNA